MSDYFDRIEQQLVSRTEARARPRRRVLRVAGVLGPVAAVAVAAAVVAVVLTAGHRTALPGSAASTESTGSARSSIVLQAHSFAGGAPSGQAIQQAVAVLGHRLAAISSRMHVSRSGADQITIAGVSPRERAQVLPLAGPGRLLFYDWEANALTSNGETVASQLTARTPDALRISQGAGGGPGSPDGGGVALYEAVMLASRQPVAEAGGSQQLSRTGPQYYLFGAPGSAACAAVAKQDMTTPAQGEHCLLAGPAASLPALQGDLPSGVTMADGQRVTVPQGTVILQAANPSANNPIAFNSPSARFYALKDNVALTGSEITNPRQSTDQSGSPDVRFAFNSLGNSQFQEVTAQIAHRGAISSTASQVLDQHFAVALDTQLITVPSIDFKVYPDGITGANGADITGLFTTRAARQTAALLRNGVLPVSLTPR
jgi:SecD/SecF fusion protein